MATKLPAVIGTKQNLKTALEMITPELQKAGSVDVDKLVNVIRTEAAKNADILKCRTDTVIQAANTAAQLGLYPLGISKLAYLVPYKQDCQLIVGYKGLMRLARQAGIKISIPQIVYENDEFSYGYGLEPYLIHKPAIEGGKIIGTYCVYKEKDQEREFLYMTDEEIQSVKKKSPGSSRPSSPWNTDYPAMARKTVIRRVCNFLDHDFEPLQKAVYEDEMSEVIEADYEVDDEITETLGKIEN